MPTGYMKKIEDARKAGTALEGKDFKSAESKAALSELLRQDNERAEAGKGNAFRDAEHEAQRKATFGKHR